MSHYSLGTVTIPHHARRYVATALKENRLSYGPFCEKFEQKFAQLHQVKHALLCSSGTAALHTILTALKLRHDWQDGDEVLVPAVTFVATINAVIHAGLTPILVDIDPHTYNLNPDLLTAALTPRTRAVMPVHLFGKPAAMDVITQVAQAHNLLVIEDSCEAIATQYQGKPVGSWGVAGAFSTHSAHILTTGVGGMITTNDASLADQMRSLINHGRDTIYISIDDDDDISDTKLKKVVAGRFCFNQVGFSYRISELEAAIGLAQLETLEKTVTKRQKNVQYLNKKLRKLSTFLQLPDEKDNIMFLHKEMPITYMVYPVVLKPAAFANSANALAELVLYLEKNGIETRPFFPILGQPAYKDFNWNEQDYPHAQYCTSSGLYIGCHQALRRADLEYAVSHLEKFFARLG